MGLARFRYFNRKHSIHSLKDNGIDIEVFGRGKKDIFLNICIGNVYSDSVFIYGEKILDRMLDTTRQNCRHL